MKLMGEHTRKMRKIGKDGFIQDGYTRSPRFRGQKMVDITNRNHYRITLGIKSWRNKYRAEVWHDKGNTGCGCGTAYRRFRY